MGLLLFAVVASAAACYAASVLFLYFRQRAFQYGPTYRDREAKGTVQFKPWKGPSGGFFGYYRPIKNPRRLVVVFHGNGGEALDRQWVAEIVPSSDLLILAEYPGFGARPGKTTQSGLLADAEHLIAEAQKTWGPLPLTLVGESLGSSVAAYLASLGKVERLALISPFVSGEAVAARRFRFFPVKWFLKDKYPTLQFIQSAQAPLHVVHGTLDELVPLDQGKAVFQAYPGKQKAFDEIPGFGNANLEQALLHSPFAVGFREFLAS